MGKSCTREKGIALIIVLILGLICFVMITGLFYMLRSSSSISGSIKRYTTALAAAKGGCNLIMAGLDAGVTFTCNGNSTCVPCPSSLNDNCTIDLPVSSLGNYTIKAYLLFTEASMDRPTTVTRVYAIRVVSSSPSGEKAIIDFVYRK